MTEPGQIKNLVANLNALHADIAAETYPNGALLRCMHCNQEKTVDGADIAGYLRDGWPKCCGTTMRIIIL